MTEANYSTGDYYHYTYDSVGNRLTEVSSVDGLPSSIAYTYDNANRLASVDSVAYTWDNNGNLLNDGANTYTYDSANRLISVNGTTSYSYNGMGDRLTQNDVHYTLDLNAGLTQVLDDGTNTYLYGNGRISQTGNSTEYFLGDALGSVRQLTNDAAEITLTKAYEPYGEETWSYGAGQSAFAFTGEAVDVNGLVYLRARYYAPTDGRFLSRDTWEGDVNSPMSFNRWNYVEGNPINHVDPTGHDDIPEWVENILEDLRIKTKECYENGDTACVWRNYQLLAQGAPLIGLPHAGDHMERYLLKLGDVHYYGGNPTNNRYASSKWLFGHSFVRQPFRRETKELWQKIHLAVLTGKASGYEITGVSETNYPEDRDLYYALGKFSIWVEANYEVNGCDVTIRPKYHFYDKYDWHPGQVAGGDIGQLLNFEDAWAASLKPSYAKEFEIFGVWVGPNKTYHFKTEWFFDWPVAKNIYESWEYADSYSEYSDIFKFDD